MKVYVGICTERGNIVFEDEAEEFVKKRGFYGDAKIVIPWFFSGNWIEKEGSHFGEPMSLTAGLFDE